MRASVLIPPDTPRSSRDMQLWLTPASSASRRWLTPARSRACLNRAPTRSKPGTGHVGCKLPRASRSQPSSVSFPFMSAIQAGVAYRALIGRPSPGYAADWAVGSPGHTPPVKSQFADYRLRWPQPPGVPWPGSPKATHGRGRRTTDGLQGDRLVRKLTQEPKEAQAQARRLVRVLTQARRAVTARQPDRQASPTGFGPGNR
jgi:hypothetical protein